MIIRVAQDTAPKFQFVVERDGLPINLTGCTVQFLIQKADATTVTKTVTVTSATTGECEVALINTDTNQAGQCYGELKITFADATIQHARHRLPFYVRSVYTDPAI